MNLESWEHKTLRNLLQEGLQEQRRKRRWGIFFKLLFWGYVLFITFIYFTNSKISPEKIINSNQKHVALIELEGTIAPDQLASSENIISALEKSFTNKNSIGVILKINSPGGTPVQAMRINNAILRLRESYPNKKLVALIDDMGTSGAYLVACGAEKIYADPSSIVGSIGVVVSSFGFDKFLEKYGVERRLYFSNKDKVMLDMFSAEDPKQRKFMEQQVAAVHQQFVDIVKSQRGSQLKISDDLFSGKFWVGVKAKELGLIDSFTNGTYELSQEEFSNSNIKNYKLVPLNFVKKYFKMF